MTITLSNLKSHAHKQRKRIGRGNASGHGSYSTRGQKGQRSRTGGRKGLRRRGLKQFLLQIPKRKGFKSLAIRPAIVNIGELEKVFKDKEIVDRDALQKAGLINKSEYKVKILGTGQLTHKLTVQANSFSKSAKSAIIKAGGRVQIVK
jgi:large subunit ribosomal protein L15